MGNRKGKKEAVDLSCLDDPLCLCKTVALLRGIKLISDKAEEKGLEFTEKMLDGGALEDYIGGMSDHLMQVNFPNHKPKRSGRPRRASTI